MTGKKCCTCGKEKDLSEFHKKHRNADGHGMLCKICKRLYDTMRRIANLEKIRKFDRDRAHQPARLAEQTASKLKRNLQDPRKRRCYNTVRKAIKKGLLVRQCCEQCGEEKTDAHHDDYSQPLVVRWLCTFCHKRWHATHDAS